MVWKASKLFGIGKAQTADKKWFVVANYWPAGNLLGTFAENVFPPTDGKIEVPKQDGPSAAGGEGKGIFNDISNAGAIKFFLPVTFVIIPDVLVTNRITKLY